MNIRLIASDIDGTIVPEGGQVSDATCRAIALCRERGIPFVLCSGRWYANVREAGVEAGLRGEDLLLAVNGNIIADMNGRCHWKKPIEDAAADAIFEIIGKKSETMMSFQWDRLLITSETGWFPRKPGFYGNFGGTDFVCEAVSREEFARRGLRGAMKIEGYSRNEEDLARMRAELVRAGMSVSASIPQNMEIMTPDMGKGRGVTALAGLLGVTRDEIMVFGDYTNDLDMFRAAGWPVAMGNAVEELKRQAKIIAPDCADDGVAKILEQYVLGEK